MILHLAPSPARPADPVAEAHHQMACAALLQVVQAARWGRMWARVFLLSDEGRRWLESCGVEPEAAWERMVAEWVRRGQG